MSSSSACANRRELLIAGLALPLAAQAQTAPPELAGWSLRGRGRMRFLGLRIYDIELWSPEPVNAERWAEQPLALVLHYARSLKGHLIAERSLTEMRRQGPLDEAEAQRWLQAMRDAFPDVNEGQRLSGRHDPERGASFWFQGAPRPGLRETAFSRRFFGIWLSAQTSEPSLRAQLLGLA